MAAIAQRASTTNPNSGNELIDMSEIEALLAEQKDIQEEGKKGGYWDPHLPATNKLKI